MGILATNFSSACCANLTTNNPEVWLNQAAYVCRDNGDGEVLKVDEFDFEHDFFLVEDDFDEFFFFDPFLFFDDFGFVGGCPFIGDFEGPVDQFDCFD